jgi:putative membrane protein
MAHRRVHRALPRVSPRALSLALVPAAGLASPCAWAHTADRFYTSGAEPWIAFALVLSAALYARGWYALTRSAGSRGRAAGRAALFAAGWLTLALALFSPLAAVSEGLFSAHMIQHELLMVIAAPLMVLGRPLAIWTWALPRSWRSAAARPFRGGIVQRVWGTLTAPLTATMQHAAAIWLWHIPRVFELSEVSIAAHAVQHSVFLFSALLFWWALLKPGRESAIGSAVLCLFVTMLHTSALGVLLTFSGDVWYPAATARAGQWGLTPVEDQQLGGLVMWVAASAPYVIAALALAARWFHDRSAGADHGEVALRAAPR